MMSIERNVNACMLLMLQGKVKAVSDAVWSKLTGVFVNDVLHDGSWPL